MYIIFVIWNKKIRSVFAPYHTHAKTCSLLTPVATRPVLFDNTYLEQYLYSGEAEAKASVNSQRSWRKGQDSGAVPASGACFGVTPLTF